MATPLRAADAAALAAKVCAACHGADGNGEDAQYPRLAGQDPRYLVKQLRDFASNQRRSEVMAPIVASLGDDEIQELGAWFASRKAAPGKSVDAGLAVKGQQIYEDGNMGEGLPACVSCHQANGGGNARFPRLAGQHAPYLAKQLLEFKQGRRANNRLMVTVAQRLSPEEIRAVATYLAGL